jgi:hypothetical protein
LSRLVDREDLPKAVALNSLTYSLARIVGPVMGAIIVNELGIPAAFAVNTASYVPLVIVLATLRVKPQDRFVAVDRRLLRGFAFVRHDPRLLLLLLAVMVVGFASDPINTEAPAFAHAFGEVDTKAGLLLGAFGVGAIVAGITFRGAETTLRKVLARNLFLLWGGITFLGLTHSLTFGYAALMLAGFGYFTASAHATTALQLGVAESQRGRVMALWGFAFLGLRPLASLVNGALAAGFGVRIAAICLSLPALAVAVIILRRPDRLFSSR